MSISETPHNKSQGLQKAAGRPKIVVPEGSPSRNSDSGSFYYRG